MTDYRGDYRPVSEWEHLRVSCHGCRGVSYQTAHNEDGMALMRPVLVPGDGTVVREVAPGVVVTEPCPVCGETDSPGWLPGFQPPV